MKIEIPGSKSYTNRALIMAALTKGAVALENPLYSDDTQTMIQCLRQLGLHIETFPEKIIVYDDISVVQEKSYDLFVQDSGTTIRFLLALLCLVPGVKTLRGSQRLNERPIQDLVIALRQLGAKIEYLETEGLPPLKVTSSSLNGHEVSINASMSSQFLSALLMLAPCLNGLQIEVNSSLISRPYVDMTVNMMREWGVKVSRVRREMHRPVLARKARANEHLVDIYKIPAAQVYQKKDYVIEGDFSSAGYFFAMAVLNRKTLTLKNLNQNSAQADRKFLDILENMGNQVMWQENAVTIASHQLLPLTIDMEDCPDQVQTMAVLAAFARGITKISGVRSLRVKETERVKALKNELAKMGIQTEDTHDTLTIHGGNPHSASIDTYGDHRMAMAFAVAKTKLPAMEIQHPEVVNKTFPNFWELFNIF